ncbi:protein of unknown function [Citrobacter amalonaticus]|uniref:Uncharacterized protein n=1 Tax=Citrobacter amalonaticus TaxID=35703 RepID=A0AAX2BC34_CITAM|nr:protein of unknown function [Citrobacter amalonaticus]
MARDALIWHTIAGNAVPGLLPPFPPLIAQSGTQQIPNIHKCPL